MASLITVSQVNPAVPIDTRPVETQQPVLTPIERQIASTSAKYGVNPEWALKIAKCESDLRQYDPETGDVLRGKQNPQDVGVFQINEKYHLEKSRELGFNIYTIKGNVEYGLWLMKNGGRQHWDYSRPCWSKASAELKITEKVEASHALVAEIKEEKAAEEKKAVDATSTANFSTPGSLVVNI